MSPSRLSAGITSGSPAEARSRAKVASMSCGSYGTAGCRSDAASLSPFSIPSYVGLPVYFGAPNTFASPCSARRDENRTEERRVGEEGRSWWWPDHLKKKKQLLWKGERVLVKESLTSSPQKLSEL